MASPIRPKEFRFPVEIEWKGGRLTEARIDGKPSLEIATPPEFRGTDPTVWSPEDALVAAAGSCLAVTIVAIAERERVPLQGLSVSAVGIVGPRADGRMGFVGIEQIVELATEADHEQAARAVVARAEQGCLVAVSLDLPVKTKVDIRVAAEAR